MRVFTDHREVDGQFSNAWLAIGNFDGLHRGHQALIDMVRHGSGPAHPAAVMSFEPHPSRVLSPDLAPPLLCTKEEKAQGLRNLGVDVCLLQTFTKEWAATSPTAFVQEVLIDSLDVGHVVVGPDFSFGRKAQGNTALLRMILEENGRALSIVDPVREKGLVCSSTKVREFVLQGKVDIAQRLLGHLYWLSGTVVPGDQRGRKLGFPTANIETKREVLPAVGVYATWVKTEDGRVFKSITNIGLRPTFDGDHLRIETHLFDFNETLYNQSLRLYFADHVRNEKRFSSADELRSQITIDCTHAKEALMGSEPRFGP